MNLKFQFIALSLSLFLCQNIKAQTFIKIDPIALGFGSLGFKVEQPFSPKGALQFQGSYLLESNRLNGAKGFGYGIALRLYSSSYYAPKGTYFSLFYAVLPASYGKTAGSLGVLFGHQILFSNNNFSVDVAAGGAVQEGGLVPQFTLSVGYHLFRGVYEND